MKDRKEIFNEERIGPAKGRPRSRNFHKQSQLVGGESLQVGGIGQYSIEQATGFRPVESQANLDDWPKKV